MPASRSRLRHARLAGAGALALLGVVGGLAGAPSPTAQKQKVDSRLATTQRRLDAARGRERVLTGQVANYNARIRAVQAKLTPLERRLTGLNAEVATLRGRLAQLTDTLTREQNELAAVMMHLRQAQGALAERLLAIYEMGEPDPVLSMLSSGSITDAVETQSLLRRITEQDKYLVNDARDTADRVRRVRDRLQAAHDEVQTSTTRAQTAQAQVRTVTDALQARRGQLDTVRADRARLLSHVRGDRRQIEAEAAGLRAESAKLAAKIIAAQNKGLVIDSTVSKAGMIWPVQGPLTSGFGMRWGRMHEGVDIAVPSGTPVVAAAPGVVIYAGWEGGYGNLVVIDHGGGVATAYGHNERVDVSVGQHVAQGQVISHSDSTGHSTGPHVHFEVRINGSAVNPLPYL